MRLAGRVCGGECVSGIFLHTSNSTYFLLVLSSAEIAMLEDPTWSSWQPRRARQWQGQNDASGKVETLPVVRPLQINLKIAKIATPREP